MGRVWYRVSRASSGSRYQRVTCGRLRSRWRRRTTRRPTSSSGRQCSGVRAAIGRDPTLRPCLATILRMREWADVAERVASTTRTSEKVAAVSAYLASLEDDADLATAAVFFSGRPFPERDARTTGIGWAQIAAIAERIAGQGPGALVAAYNESAD